MSTKTTFKRIALVTVAALSFGLLTSVTPASAVATALTASVGPNGATSLTVVGGDSTTAAALIRLDVTQSDTITTSSLQGGLKQGDTITASVIAPTSTTRGGSVADTSTAVGLLGGSARSDFVMLESVGQTTGSRNTTAATAVSSATAWDRLAFGHNADNKGFYLDSATALMGAGAAHARAADGKISAENTGFINMDATHELTDFEYVKSYYVTVRARVGADIMDKGAYTFAFQLADTNGVVRGNASVKIDFVSTAATSGAVVGVSVSTGTFLANTAVATYDSTSAAWAKATLTNRDGGLVRTWLGAVPAISVAHQYQTTAAPTWTDTVTVTINDSGTYGSDFGTGATGNPLGSSTNRGFDGVYGVAFTTGEASSATTGQAYRMWAAYGNAPIVTAAFTVFPVSGSGTARAGNTDVLVTAAGMSAADQELISGTATTARTTKTWTLPTTTTSATLKFWIQTSADTATPGALITATPTWTGTVGTSQITPATSTTGTVYTTDALGNFSVTVTNSAPVAGATLTLVLSGGAAFGAGTYTAVLTWATPVASSIAIADPIAGISVLAGSTNVTTVIVKDQFGNPVKDQVVTVSTSQTPAIVLAAGTVAPVISPITTNAAGTATYSFTPAAGALTGTVSFNTAPTPQATAASRVYTYVATLPVVATLTGYFDRSWATTPATLVPATGIYNASGSAFVLEDARNISKPMTTDANTTNDEIALLFTGLTAAGVSATGASVTVTAGAGGHILDASDLPVKSRTFAITATGTAAIKVLATGTGAITFTATSGTVTATASMWVAGRLNTDNSNTAGRFVTVTSAKTGAANGSGVPVTVAVTDRYGNPVSGVALNVVASGVGSFMGGNITQSFTTDASGSYTFLANTTLSDGGVAKFTATTGTVGSFDSVVGYVGATEVDSTLAAGNASASAEITFAAGASATDVAQAATDAAAEATDAANAATDAANAAAEAADAATAAAQDAADAVAALSTQVSEMVNALKKQITALTNLVIKIQKKVRA
jgi:trimeric autotransporter adhesin